MAVWRNEYGIGGSVYDHRAGDKDHESGRCKDRAGSAAFFAVPCITVLFAFAGGMVVNILI